MNKKTIINSTYADAIANESKWQEGMEINLTDKVIPIPADPVGSTDSIDKDKLPFVNANGQYELNHIVFPVTSVAGKTGNVGLDEDDIAEGTTYKKFTSAEKTKLTNLKTQTQFDAEFQNIREVAEGKCKAFVLSYNETQPTSSNWQSNKYYTLEGTLLSTYAEFDAYIKDGFAAGRQFLNGKFNSQDASISLVGGTGANIFPGYIICYMMMENSQGYYNTVSVVVRVFYNQKYQIKVGDVFLVIETDVPDRWFGPTFQGPNAYKLETTKIDLTQFYTKSQSDARYVRMDGVDPYITDAYKQNARTNIDAMTNIIKISSSILGG